MDRLRFVAQALAVAALVAVGGCTTTIIPPANVEDPATVVLMDFGRTAGLALPGLAGEAGQDTAVHYVFGDWNFYAMRNTGVLDGIRALFWPTPGTLGRRIADGPIDSGRTLQSLQSRSVQTYPIIVPRRQAEALRRRLDAEFEAGRATRVETGSLDLEFVRHPQAYTGWYNSNHQVRDWLVELGCEARGAAFLSRWRIELPALRP